jgi:HPt (histidine-containing phosphotransfer) domain-containing protein
MLAELWQRGLPRLRSRLELLDRATAAAEAGALDRDMREQAAEVAHKLAGTLGMFGYDGGTDTARRIELLLEAPSPVDPRKFRSLTSALRQAVDLQLPDAPAR